MNKTHEELALEATEKTIQQWLVDGLTPNRDYPTPTEHILAAITAAVQAEREQAAKVLKALRIQILLSSFAPGPIQTIEAELARLSLNDSPPALSNDA